MGLCRNLILGSVTKQQRSLAPSNIKMFESGFFDSLRAGDVKHENAQPEWARLPPRSREEWLMRLKRECESWPIKNREAEDLLEQGGAPAVIGDLNDIGRDLMQHAREEKGRERGGKEEKFVLIQQLGRALFWMKPKEGYKSWRQDCMALVIDFFTDHKKRSAGIKVIANRKRCFDTYMIVSLQFS